MTREEAKRKLFDMNCMHNDFADEHFILLMEIYDDFDIEDIENSPSVAYEDGYQVATKENKKEISELKNKYNELLFAVESKFQNESRHETALRYIVDHERSTNSPVKYDG